jgi:antirestriction protein ArdC
MTNFSTNHALPVRAGAGLATERTAHIMKKDIKVEVTNQIIAHLEKGLDGGWEKPFFSGAAGLSYNVKSKKAYRGINVMILAMSGYASPIWGTWNQWFELGGGKREKVNGKWVTTTPSRYSVKNQKSTAIIFWKPIEKENDAGEKYSFLFARGYNVFNAEQVDGYEAPAPTEPAKDETETVAEADAFFEATGVDIRTAPGGAFFVPSMNYVSMPPRTDFKATSTSTGTDTYYSTLAHEVTHATGHKSRLDRSFKGIFGDSNYAAEELVAEIGSAMVMNHLGLNATVREDHSKYIKSWLAALRDDHNAIFTAASKAQAALDWIVACQDSAEMAEAA